MIRSQGGSVLYVPNSRLLNDLYCVEWDVKLYYTIPYHTVPNFKRIALFLQKLLGGPKILKLGHVTLSHALLNLKR